MKYTNQKQRLLIYFTCETWMQHAQTKLAQPVFLNILELVSAFESEVWKCESSPDVVERSGIQILQQKVQNLMVKFESATI